MPFLTLSKCHYQHGHLNPFIVCTQLRTRSTYLSYSWCRYIIYISVVKQSGGLTGCRSPTCLAVPVQCKRALAHSSLQNYNAALEDVTNAQKMDEKNLVGKTPILQ